MITERGLARLERKRCKQSGPFPNKPPSVHGHFAFATCGPSKFVALRFKNAHKLLRHVQRTQLFKKGREPCARYLMIGPEKLFTRKF